MKKLLTVLLSMALALSLAAPAFAAPADGAYTVDGEPAPVYTPGEAIPISAILDESLGVIGGQDGPTAIVTTTPEGLDPSDFSALLEEIAREGIGAAHLSPEQYLADHPGLEEQLKAGTYDYFAREYGDYWATPEEYMEALGITEEEFLDEMVWEQAWDLISEEAAQLRVNALKEALGGVPGQVGVMVNGAYVKFPDAAPEIAGGRTMVPVRALVETLGGEVDYNHGAVTFTMDGYAYEFAIGSATVKVSPTAGNDKDVPQPEDIEMDCAPYLKGGRTYVPIRFISEALGYEVGWDAEYETAILLDREALAAEIDKSFTIMNKVQAAANPVLEEGKIWSTDVKGGLSLTAFDTLNGSKTYKLDLAGKALVNNEAANGTCSITISDNAVDALLAQVLDAYWYLDGEDEEIELLRTVLTSLKDMEVIMTREGMVWVHAPILDELAGTDNVWLDTNLGAELGELMFAETDTATMGSVLAAMTGSDSVAAMAGLSQMTSYLDKLYGDDKFTTSGGVSTRTIGVDDLLALYDGMGLTEDDIAEAKAAFKEYEITMKVDGNGGATVAIKMETAPQAGVPGMRITMDVKQSGGNVAMDMSFHIANLGEATLTLTQTLKTTSEAPKAEPPEGATLVDMDNGAELLVP